MSTDLALKVDDLRYRYPDRSDPAVDGMTFHVMAGEVFGFLGPSGAGKTTTQRAILGLVRGWTGTIELWGRDRRAWGSELFDRVGVAFELPAGYPRLTAREDLSHFANLHQHTCRDAGELLAEVGLAGAADTPVGSFSKGMRIRLNLARALLHDPQLLFLDEPTAGLDPVNAGMVRALIRRERDRGCTIFLTTHDMLTADAVCDRVAFVVDGRIAACDDPKALRLGNGHRRLTVRYATPSGAATATFPLDQAATGLVDLLASGTVQTVHSTEPTLDEIFASITGQALV